MKKNHFKKYVMSPLQNLLMFCLMSAIVPFAQADLFDMSINSGDASQGDVTNEQCGQLDQDLARSLGCDTIDQVIDFTEYTGQLEGPDAGNYDSALTQSRDARSFIQTIVNFALSFLGLIAVIVIIYGGFLYVLSRGDEEMTGNGKKAITYALIGIVIIMASFAIVNTLIGAGGGTGSGDGDGGATAGNATILDAGASFDLDAVLSELESVSADFLDSYDRYLTVGQTVAYMSSLEMPFVVDVKNTNATLGGAIGALGGLLSGKDKDYVDEYTLIDEADINRYIEDLRLNITIIQNESDTLSDTFEAAQSLFDYLRSGGFGFKRQNWFALFAPFSQAANLNDDSRNTNALGKACSNVGVSNNFRSFGLGVDIYSTEVTLIDDNMCGFFSAIQAAADADYKREVEELSLRVDQLAKLFDTEALAGGASSLATVGQLFDDAFNAMKNAADPKNASAFHSRDVLERINKAYVAVDGLEFVQVRLSASVLRGNAPLIVRFDALNTLDPSGETVGDPQITWDFGEDGANLFDDASGAATANTFEKAGTYRVKVRVVSSQDGIAAGLAILNVVVDPPKSRIVLSANDVTIADFKVDDRCTAFPAIDNNAFKVTLAEAKAGIRFDASKSVDGQCNSAGLSFAEWDFGDNETLSGPWSGEDVRRPVHAYGVEGTYQVSFTVTDNTGVKDKKYFTLFVASPAARISASAAEGVIGSEFTFDAGASSADIGTIVAYEWSLIRGGVVLELDETSDSISRSFDAPGIYTVQLTVRDAGGASDTTSVDIFVESQAPSAGFSAEIENSAKPGVLILDASQSIDPDASDVLSYEWLIEGTENVDYEILDEIDAGEKLRVEFLRTGDFNVSLTVKDQHEAPIQKTSIVSRNINVASILDVELELMNSPARHLDPSGQLEVKWTAKSKAATGFEIDFGDGVTDFTETLIFDEASFTHNYEKAGIFYATLTAYDDLDNKNSITKRVFVGSGENPLAVIEVSGQGEDISYAPNFTGNVNTQFLFNANDSINLDGSSKNLEYSWNFGDGVLSSQANVTHRFDEVGVFKVTLTVRDANDPLLQSSSEVMISILGLPPKIRSFSITPAESSLETPLRVNVQVDAFDEDGSIGFYKAWYYDVRDSAEELGVVISESSNFQMLINTNGKSGETVEYAFALEVRDNDNKTATSLDGDETLSPRLSVVNGPNENPVAMFSVDRSSIFLGDSILFSSSSYDPDGEIVSYTWDIGNDGFFNDTPSKEPSLEYTFKSIHPDGVDVRLKVEDNAGSTHVSDVLKVYVDALSDPPDAAFLASVDGMKVNFKNNSIIDSENAASLHAVYWDFNTLLDANGNGVKDDDIESYEETVEITYPAFGTYTVKMTVVDSSGQSDEVTRTVQVLNADPPDVDFTFEIDEYEVFFTDKTKIDASYEDLEIDTYTWDFDTSFDVDGDGDPSNDLDSDRSNPGFTYSKPGKYKVKLSVTDSLGQAGSIVKEFEVLGALQGMTVGFSSLPEANASKQIVISGDRADVTYFYGAEGGGGSFVYEIDGNIFFDSDGDGNRENDVDHSSDKAGSWKTTYLKSYGTIVSKLTVEDLETGDKKAQTLQVVFNGSFGAANLLNSTPAGFFTFFVISLFGLIITLTAISRLTLFHIKK